MQIGISKLTKYHNKYYALNILYNFSNPVHISYSWIFYKCIFFKIYDKGTSVAKNRGTFKN